MASPTEFVDWQQNTKPNKSMAMLIAFFRVLSGCQPKDGKIGYDWPMQFPTRAVTKTVPLKFMGIDMKFKLSHALFSSNRIDDGTMLLLKTLAQQKAVPETGRVLDAGCGIGPLAIALKKRWPGLSVHAHDRLALACAFTQENSRLNSIEIDVTPGLLMQSTDGPFDLIVSNLPAKAGSPVLADALRHAGQLITPQGIVAVVIVMPLADWAIQCLKEFKADILFTEDTRDYRVIHYRLSNPCPAKSASIEDGIPASYIRSKFSWPGPRGNLAQHCLWGLPNFDALDYRHEIALELIGKTKWSGENLIWEPDQGHMASALAQLCGAAPQLAANDFLSFRSAEFNLKRQGFPGAICHCLPSIAALQELPSASFDGLIINIHSEPEIKWVDETVDAILHLAKPGASVLLTGTSTDLARFCAESRDLSIVHDKKYRGWRGTLFQRKGVHK